MRPDVFKYAANPFFALALLCLLLMAGETFQTLLQYDRYAILHGEFWRLFTCHFTHANLQHFLLNIAGTALLLLLFYKEYRPLQWVAFLLFTALLISAGLFFFEPHLQHYVGLSGVLHGMLVMGIAAEMARGSRLYILLLLLLGIKLIMEHLVAPMPLSNHIIGIPVITAAHLFGALGGTVAAYVILRRGRIKAAGTSAL